MLGALGHAGFFLGTVLYSEIALAQVLGPTSAPEQEAPAAARDPEPPASEPKEKKDGGERVSLTLSPLHLISPIFELQVEAMVVPHFGAGVIGGIGSLAAESADPVIDGERFAVYELGLQLVAYPLRHFSSLQLGAELLWIYVNAENFNGQEIRADAGGVAVGPLVGYKLITQGGFTFFAQGGFEYVFVKAVARDTLGNSASKEDSTFIPLLNLNIGWSF